MADPPDKADDLECRTIAAHRAYLDAFSAWERLVTSDPSGQDEEYMAACNEAEARKERLRVVFRDLVGELGYLPLRSGISLPRDC